MNRRSAIKRTALLMGGAISASAISAIMSGCKAEPQLAWTPTFFNLNQGLTMTEIAERIIPATDTPGAKEIGVPQFIDLALGDCYEEKAQNILLAGLERVEKESLESYSKSFIDLAPEQMDELLKTYDREAFDNEDDERHFFTTLKELTLLGYFTSEYGATEVLQYDPVPGAYVGCKPLAEVGKTWAT